MPDLYVQLDVNYLDDPRVMRVGVEAELLYVRGLCLAKRLMSDGHIDRYHLGRLGHDLEDVREAAKELEAIGLWEPNEDGWQIRGWLNHNPSKAEIQAKRDAERDRKSQWRATRDTSAASDGTPRHRADSRDRVETETKTESGEGGAIRAHRIPDTFRVTDEMIAYVKERAPDVDWNLETERFVNWAKSASGKNALKRDWVRAWKNWMTDPNKVKHRRPEQWP